MNAPTAETVTKKKRPTFKMPDAYVLLFTIAFICAIASYVVPAGEFDRVTKGEVTTAVPEATIRLNNLQSVLSVFSHPFRME
ncbi:hypothetical protein RA13_00010 [Bacillus atrophaeus]|nr:hypothetical protein RA13_00010 [Bacillus atrophaeus]